MIHSLPQLPRKCPEFTAAVLETYSKDTSVHLKFLEVLMLAAVGGHKLEIELALMGYVLAEEGYKMACNWHVWVSCLAGAHQGIFPASLTVLSTVVGK
jgi:hypothetical protein